MKKGETKIIANVRVGKPDAKPSTPSHVKGVGSGNSPGRLKKQAGIIPVDEYKAVGTAERSTGITPEASNPIDPDMPNLSPA